MRQSAQIKKDQVLAELIAARREVLAQTGGFDEGYFMYSEELDWQRRVRQAGWKVVYLPDAVIVLDELPHTATGKVLKGALRARFRDYLLIATRSRA